MFADMKAFPSDPLKSRGNPLKKGVFSTLRGGQNPSFAKRERAEER